MTEIERADRAQRLRLLLMAEGAPESVLAKAEVFVDQESESVSFRPLYIKAYKTVSVAHITSPGKRTPGRIRPESVSAVDCQNWLAAVAAKGVGRRGPDTGIRKLICLRVSPGLYVDCAVRGFYLESCDAILPPPATTAGRPASPEK